jgi:hypothetical protein
VLFPVIAVTSTQACAFSSASERSWLLFTNSWHLV